MKNVMKCKHCKGPIEIRMPVPKSGCDHLYYPENCVICSKKTTKNHTTHHFGCECGEEMFEKLLEKLDHSNHLLKALGFGKSDYCEEHEKIIKKAKEMIE